jgi:hypothetical protein
MGDPSNHYDEQRELSMADEGGAAGAQMEAEEDAGTVTRTTGLKEFALVVGVFALASYYAIRKLKKKERPPHLHAV